jgi:hypothetical protein
MPNKKRRKTLMMRKIGIIAVLALLLTALAAVPALAQVAPGTYTPTADSFDSANAPGSSNLRSGTPSCTVEADLDVVCDPYVLGGVGNTNADLELTATWSATIDCNNPGNNRNNPIESHENTFTSSPEVELTSSRNGQLRVSGIDASPGDVEQVCPNDRWEPVIREGTLELESFTYTLTFLGFDDPYITITAP